MAHPVTVLVLTPSVCGHYYGEVIAGLSREVAASGGRIVLVQTLDGGTRRDEESELSAFSTPVAWSEVDGVVSITTAGSGSYLQRLRDAGKPVVLASTRMPGFQAPLAVPDNHGGTVAAVEHLIAHGHTRIGFVGNLAQPDVYDRYAAYVQALEAHDLVPDPALVFAAPNNDFPGGARAAQDVLSASERPTALMVGTDRNAIGLMRTLSSAGLAIPGDVAVVGFDNMEEAGFSSPPLTSVNQRFGEVGALAARLVLAQIRGDEVPFTAHVLPTAPLELRGSCGCATDALGTGIGGTGQPLDVAPAMSRDELEHALYTSLLSGHDGTDEAMRAAVVDAVGGAGRLRHRHDITAAEIQSLLTSLHGLTTRPEILRRIAGAVMYFLQHGGPVASDRHPTGAATGNLSQVSTALWQLQAGAFLQQAETTQTALQEQYVVDAAMRDAGGSDPRGLDWLGATDVEAGVLALWQDAPASGRLRIAGSYDPAGLLPDLVGTSTVPQSFPPNALVGAPRTRDRSVCIVIPLCTANRDWGLLAVVGDINTTSALETYRHWAAQLCASLEAQELQDAVRTSEERYALAARASNDGLWEWSPRTREVFMSDRCHALLDLPPGGGDDMRETLLGLVHPDDLPGIRRVMGGVIRGVAETASIEYRCRSSDGTYRWVLARALGVRSADGSIDRVVGSLSDIHERHSLEDQLRENALYDALTGLPNRRMFLSRLNDAVALWHRSQTPFAVIFLDLDGFKAINDSLGHQIGDRVLTAVGTRIKQELREVDTGARFGGDEFAILLHDTAEDGVLQVAQRVQRRLAEPIDLDGHVFAIGASLGVATSAIDYTSAEDVLRDADTAMYGAKETERGTMSFFDSSMHEQVVHDLQLNAELRRALDEHQFEMHYQPIVNLVTGRTDRFEALVRWRHPARGLVLPDQFLPAMMETGSIIELGHWIIGDVCRQLAAWGPGVANVALNVSDREFWHSGLLTHLVSSLERHRITADRLTVEITEGVIMRRPDVALRLMQDMHEAGFELHIDDFGTGYSSLETLHRFPVDAFKIDRSFIAGLTTSDRTEELVRAIITMGKALGLAVVAEGVETPEQLRFLQDIGCRAAQGFLFMPAVPAEQAPGLLARVLGQRSTDPETVPRISRGTVNGGHGRGDHGQQPVSLAGADR